MDAKTRRSNPTDVVGSNIIPALTFEEYQSGNINESVQLRDSTPWTIETNELSDSIERSKSQNETLARDFQIFKSRIEYQINLINAKLKIDNDPISK